MIKIKYIESIKGTSKENEDVVSFNNDYCWIIDGATDVFDSTSQIGITVSKYVNELSNELHLLCNNEKELDVIMTQAISKVTSKYLKSTDFSEELFAKLPTFSFIFCRELGHKFEYLLLGDCYLILNGRTITDKRIIDFSKNNKSKILSSLSSNISITAEDRISIFRKTRLKANQNGGYPIGSMCPNSISSAIKGKVSINEVNNFILMTDGYFNLYNSSKSLVENTKSIATNNQIDKVYGKKDDASVLEGIII